jgi:hypothetical protein
MTNKFIGKIRTNRKGVGFFRGVGIDDFVSIQPEDMRTALDFDEVEIETMGKNK